MPGRRWRRRSQASGGTFGVVKRPDGRLQVTYNGLALYAYVHDETNQVLCDNVDRWLVVRV